MSNYPQDIANQALDAAGLDFTLGDIGEGTRPGQVLLRAYGQCMRQLLRSAHWNFARVMKPLTLLADASGQTPDVGTQVVAPWTYEYSMPLDMMKARFLPWNALTPQALVPSGNIAQPDIPETSTTQPPWPPAARLVPAPFLITLDTNYPVDTSDPNWINFQGVSPAGRVVILSNVQQAWLVYTAFIPYPNVWDAEFRAALVAYLASEIALPLNSDKKFGLMMRDRNFEIAKKKVTAARVTNGNESAFPQTTDHLPDWMAVRFAGAGPGGWGNSGPGCGGAWGGFGNGWNGMGYLGYGWDTAIF